MRAALQFSIFLFILFAILGGVHYYLQRRFLAAFFLLNDRARRLVQVTVAFLAISFPGARLLGRLTGPNALTEAANWFAAIWLGMALYLFLTALCVHLVEFVLRKTGALTRIARLLKGGERWVGLLAVMGNGLTLSGIALHQASLPAQITPVEISLPDLPDVLEGFQIVHLSDVHIGMMIHAQKLTQLVDQVNELKPDVVVITGDLVDEDASYLQDLSEPLKRFRTRYGVLAVTGNHDVYAGVEDVIRYSNEGGVRFLKNESVLVAQSIRFWGLDDKSMLRYSKSKITTMEQLLSQMPEKNSPSEKRVPQILLYHQPLDFEKAHQLGVDLMLSGHTHGGQLWPISYISQRIYPRNAGLFQIGNSFLYVSRGTGTWGPPMRLGAPSEIVRLRLSKRR